MGGVSGGRLFTGDVRKDPVTIFVSDGFANCDGGFLVGVLQDHDFGEFDTEATVEVSITRQYHAEGRSDRSATSLASCGWLLPVSSLIELDAMIGDVSVLHGMMIILGRSFSRG